MSPVGFVVVVSCHEVEKILQIHVTLVARKIEVQKMLRHYNMEHTFQIRPYSEVRDELRDFDLLQFEGSDFVSDLIKYAQRSVLKPRSKEIPTSSNAGYFSHSGMVLTGRMLRGVENVEEDGLYVWEATMSGALGQGVYDISGEWHLGVQLRKLDEVVPAYTAGGVGKKANGEVKVAVCKLKQEFRSRIDYDYEMYRSRFAPIFAKYQGRRWDAQPVSLLAGLLKCCRCCGAHTEDIFDTEDWVFCSEMVACVYKDLGLFPATCEPKYVVPMDFLGHDTDAIENGGIPVIVDAPILMSV